MRSNHNVFTSRASSAMTRAACVAALVFAWSGRAAAQTDVNGPTPASWAEVGVGNVATGDSTGLFKAGEYNGLGHTGAFLLSNVDLRGGGTYDTDNALRWRIRGTNLGLENRNVTAEIGVQGHVRATFRYDELLRNRSDSYQTPFLGVGTNTLSLPSAWMVPYIPRAAARTIAGRRRVRAAWCRRSRTRPTSIRRPDRRPSAS